MLNIRIAANYAYNQIKSRNVPGKGESEKVKPSVCVALGAIYKMMQRKASSKWINTTKKSSGPAS